MYAILEFLGGIEKMAQRGKYFTVFVSDDNGVSYDKIGGRVSGSAPTSTDMIDATNADSEGFKEFITGDTTQSLEFSFHWEEGDLGQELLLSANYTNPKPTYKYKWMMKEGAGNKQWVADGIITNFSPDASDVQVVNVTIQISNLPVMTEQ
jgi:hypothetical protein